MRVTDAQLKEFLISTDLIKDTEWDAVAKKAAKKSARVDDVLVDEGKLTRQDLAKLKAYILGIPYMDLEHEKIEYETLSFIPEPVARRNNIVAFKKTGNDLEVAMLDPDDLATVEFIKKKTGLNIRPVLTSEDSMKHALVQYQKSLQAEFGDIIQKEAKGVSSLGSDGLLTIKKLGEEVAASDKQEDLQKLAEDLPIIKIVDTLIRHAILQRASDIHIEPGEKEVVIRYRIDGILHDAMVLPRQVAAGIIARIKVMSNLRLDEHRRPQDGRFMIETEADKISFRVSILPVYDGEKAVMRLLPEGVKGFSMESLGFHGSSLERVHEAINKSTGMLLVTGPTGSGKSTTLYSVLDILNSPEVNISTVEDPIEYHMPRINQSQVRPDIGFTFASGLRSLVRQDPDVIMVGEIRDGETADLAINAALTGHMVLSTLHTNSAAGSLPRLIDMGAEPFLIVSTVNAIVAQRLVRRLAGRKDEYALSDAEIEQLAKQANLDMVLAALIEEKIVKKGTKFSEIKFYKPVASEDAPDGYKSRIGIHEVMVMTPTVKELVMQNATADKIEAQARKEGMLTMTEDGIFKCAQGITTIEEVLRATRE